MQPHAVKLALAVCTPFPFRRLANGSYSYDNISPLWHRARSALAFPTNFHMVEIHCDGMEVGEARNSAVLRCLQHNPRPEFLFFLDYDVLPTYDAVTKLLYRASHFPDYDIYTGVYCSKSAIPEPLIYRGNGMGAYWDWTVGDILTTERDGIDGTHMGLTLIRMSLFDRFPWDENKPWFQTVNTKRYENGTLKHDRGTEDLRFYKHASESGVDIKILVDTSVLAGHIDTGTGTIYGLPTDSAPVKRAHWMRAEPQQDNSAEPEKLCLDLGAGSRRREWSGYTTKTTDIRSGAGADYVQDSRYLNLPDNSFDMVASSHHLEHIPRWEQEQVWSEIFRVCKPGGRIEHIVPNIAWAADKISSGDGVDEHVMNVLYGAQEAHGYDRQFNLHYFGYTPEIARGLAENAGFVNVEVRDWHDDEKLGYEIHLTGEKPHPHQETLPKTNVPEKEPHDGLGDLDLISLIHDSQ